MDIINALVLFLLIFVISSFLYKVFQEAETFYKNYKQLLDLEIERNKLEERKELIKNCASELMDGRVDSRFSKEVKLYKEFLNQYFTIENIERLKQEEENKQTKGE